MFFKNINMKLKLFTLLTLSILTVLMVFAEDKSSLSEIISFKAENNHLFVEVAKKYPQVVFLQEPSKLNVKFINAKYHKQFNLDEEMISNLLKQLTFIKDVTLSVNKNIDLQTESISIDFDLLPENQVAPKVISTIKNKVTIVFVVKQDVLDAEQKKNESEKQKQELNNKITEKYNIAATEYAKGNLSSAENIYKEIIAEHPDFLAAKYNLARISLDKNNYDEAIGLLKSILDDCNALPNELKDNKLLLLAHNLLGIVYYHKDLVTDSNAEFSNVIEINNQFPDVYFNIALNHEKDKDLTAAIANLQKAVDLNLNYSEAYFHLGILNAVLENKQEAINSFNKVIEIASNQNLVDLSKEELKKLDKKR